MDKEVVLKRLREHEESLHRAGILHLRLFGSVARGDAGADSDVDLIVDFDDVRRRSLVSMGSVQMDLSDIVGCEVDVAVQGWLKAGVAESASREAILVF